MDETKGAFINEIKEEINAYARLRIELFKVNSYEKIAKVTAAVFSVMIIFILFLFLTVFGSIVGGFYFSKLTGSHIEGFGILTGIYLVLLVLILAFRKQLFEKIIINKMIEILFENDDKSENQNT